MTMSLDSLSHALIHTKHAKYIIKLISYIILPYQSMCYGY